jgi:quercetin dioxygenase-like cupin family protein
LAGDFFGQLSRLIAMTHGGVSMNKAVITRAAQARTIDLPGGDLTWFVARELGNSDTMTVGLARIHPGQMNPRHYHPNCEEVLHVLQGRIIHTMDDHQAEMERGDTISIPANVIHNARNIGDVDALLFLCFSSAERETVWV